MEFSFEVPKHSMQYSPEYCTVCSTLLQVGYACRLYPHNKALRCGVKYCEQVSVKSRWVSIQIVCIYLLGAFDLQKHRGHSYCNRGGGFKSKAVPRRAPLHRQCLRIDKIMKSFVNVYEPTCPNSYLSCLQQ